MHFIYITLQRGDLSQGAGFFAQGDEALTKLSLDDIFMAGITCGAKHGMRSIDEGGRSLRNVLR